MEDPHARVVDLPDAGELGGLRAHDLDRRFGRLRLPGDPDREERRSRSRSPRRPRSRRRRARARPANRWKTPSSLGGDNTPLRRGDTPLYGVRPRPDSAQHPLEDEVMNRVERVPVREPGEAVGIEDRRLRTASRRTRRCRPRTAARCVPGSSSRLPAAAADPARRPRPARSRACLPPPAERDPVARGEARRRRRARPGGRATARSRSRSTSRSRRRSAGSARTSAPATQRLGSCATRRRAGRSVTPPQFRPRCADSASDHRVSANSRSSFASARSIASRKPRGRIGNTSRAAPSRTSGVVAQALDERPADARVDRRHDAQPEPGDTRRRERDAEQRAPEAGLTRVLPHQVCVRDAVGAADLEQPALLELEVEGGEQIREHVLDRDRLRA